VSDPKTDVDTASLITPGRLLAQLAGFAVGVALLVWIIIKAIGEGDWYRIAQAGPWLLAALIGCTLISTLVNGATFWVTVQPLKRIRFWDMQRVNFVSNMLNYAPIRLGAIARLFYHLRVDGLSLLQVGAWFSLIGYTLLLGVASCVLATIVRDRLDFIWGVLVGGQLILGGIMIRVVVNLPLIVRYGRGIDQMATDHRALWGAIALRVADLAAFMGRMGVAALILDIHLPAAHILALSLVALMASLIPFGRVGFREFCVAAAAQRLSMLAGEVEANMNQLALVESAGEALVFIPLGATVLVWFRHRCHLGKRADAGDGA
jgi:hypothetical protein